MYYILSQKTMTLRTNDLYSYYTSRGICRIFLCLCLSYSFVFNIFDTSVIDTYNF
jgi:hypothetical protein